MREREFYIDKREEGLRYIKMALDNATANRKETIKVEDEVKAAIAFDERPQEFYIKAFGAIDGFGRELLQKIAEEAFENGKIIRMSIDSESPIEYYAEIGFNPDKHYPDRYMTADPEILLAGIEEKNWKKTNN